MAKQIIALFILVSIQISNSIPGVSFDPFDYSPDGDIVIRKEEDIFCPTDESVNLPGLGLRRIPDNNLVKSRNIKNINLSNNDIVRLPINAFNETPNLYCLNLAGNKLASEWLGFQHDVLNTLILDHQRYARGIELVHEAQTSNLLGRFPNLETLSFKGMPFDYAEQFLTMAPRLRNLYISDSEFRSLRSDMGEAMPYLKTLHLERNRISSIRNVNFGNVEALYLDGNSELNGVFTDTSNARNLKILSLSNCSITVLPTIEIASLKVLDVSYNLIQSINAENMSMLRDEPSLEVLDLSHNKLTTLPSLDDMDYLEQLSLSYNWIENVNERFAPGSLVTLNMRGNRISLIDSVAFENLVLLRNLDLSQNKLQHLPTDWNEGLRLLRNLNLKSNRFFYLQDTAVYQLPNLQRLYVGGNQFNYIDSFTLANYVPENCTVYVA